MDYETVKAGVKIIDDKLQGKEVKKKDVDKLVDGAVMAGIGIGLAGVCSLGKSLFGKEKKQK